MSLSSSDRSFTSPTRVHQRASSSHSGSEVIGRSRDSIHGLNNILTEFEDLWVKNNAHGRSQSDVLPTSDAASNEISRRVFSEPQSYSYRQDPNSELFETANEGDSLIFSPIEPADTLVLASTEPVDDPAYTMRIQDGEVPRSVPHMRQARESMQSHRASIHGSPSSAKTDVATAKDSPVRAGVAAQPQSADLTPRRALRESPTRVPSGPPPALPQVSPLSRKKKTVKLDDTTPQVAPAPRRKPSGPRPQSRSSSGPDPPRRSSKREIKRHHFTQSSIENLLATKPDYTLDEIKLPLAERQLLDRFVDTLSKITVEIDLDEGKRPEARRRMNNALRALEGWI